MMTPFGAAHSDRMDPTLVAALVAILKAVTVIVMAIGRTAIGLGGGRNRSGQRPDSQRAGQGEGDDFHMGHLLVGGFPQPDR